MPDHRYMYVIPGRDYEITWSWDMKTTNVDRGFIPSPACGRATVLEISYHKPFCSAMAYRF